jgi:hypothetical protein
MSSWNKEFYCLLLLLNLYTCFKAFLDRQLQPLAEKIIRLFVLHGALLRPIGDKNVLDNRVIY